MKKPVNSDKYRDLIKTSHDLFWKFGIRRVTIEEICREAGVSKMTFYRFFANKNELAIAVLADMFDAIEKDYRELMDRDIPFEDKIRQQLLMKFEGTNDISAELVKDLYGDPESEIFGFWQKRANTMLQQVIADYKKAQEEGWIRQNVKLEFIVYMSNKTIEMANDKSLQALYPNMQSLIMEIANLYFYGILDHTRK